VGEVTLVSVLMFLSEKSGSIFIMKSQKEIWRVILAVAMVVVGVLHFAVPVPFVRIMPPQLPYPLELVYISGFFEILGGMGLLVPPVSRAAAWGLIALFIAVFPANINQAVNSIAIEGIPHIPILYWIRLPFQAVFIGWAWLYTQPNEGNQQASIIPNLPKLSKE
jgi:uncharacterized membrane protein